MMRIRTKAWLLIAVVSFAVAVICCNSIVSLNRITAIDSNQKILNQVNIKLLESRRQEKNYQLRGLEKHGEDMFSAIEKWDQLLAQASGLVDNAQAQLNQMYGKRLIRASQEMKAYETVFRDRVAHYQNNTQAWDSSQDRHFVTRARNCQELILEILNIEANRKFAIMHQSKMLTYILGGGVVAVLGVFGYLLMAQLVRPVVVLTSMLREIASREGNLTLRLRVRQKDEIGDLAQYFNTFIDAIQVIIQEVASRIKTLATASGQLDTISAGLKKNAEETSEKSMGMTSAGTQMNANMDYITTASQETIVSIEQMVLATGGMSANIGNIVQNTDKAREISDRAVAKTQSASVRIMELGNSAKNIGRVTETITEISEQTHLLALNATIEAARAGAAGLGFVVVANEIKALARQTAEATQDIEKDILEIQQVTLSTSREIGQISEIIHEIDKIISSIAALVEEQHDTTRAFAQNLSGVSDKFHGVNENLSQGAEATREMSREISQIDRSAKEVYGTSSLVRTSSEDLAALSHELKKIIGCLRI